MHLLAFLAGSLAVAGIVMVASLWVGLGVGAAVGMTVGALVIAQVLYLITIALMARAEDRANPAPDKTTTASLRPPAKLTPAKVTPAKATSSGNTR